MLQIVRNIQLPNFPPCPKALLEACLKLICVTLPLLTLPAIAVAETDPKKLMEELCIKKKVSSRGRPNRIQAMASMNAVIQWINATKKKHGEEYSLWHAAFDTKISCEKIKDSDYHICFAAAKPCLPRKKEKKEEKLKDLAPKNAPQSQ